MGFDPLCDETRACLSENYVCRQTCFHTSCAFKALKNLLFEYFFNSRKSIANCSDQKQGTQTTPIKKMNTKNTQLSSFQPNKNNKDIKEYSRVDKSSQISPVFHFNTSPKIVCFNNIPVCSGQTLQLSSLRPEGLLGASGCVCTSADPLLQSPFLTVCRHSLISNIKVCLICVTMRASRSAHVIV